MKRRQTILRQLLLNILVPVLTIFVIVFALTYRYNTQRLETTARQQKQSIVAETRNLLSYYDYAMRTHEQAFIEEMRGVAHDLTHKYLKEREIWTPSTCSASAAKWDSILRGSISTSSTRNLW